MLLTTLSQRRYTCNPMFSTYKLSITFLVHAFSRHCSTTWMRQIRQFFVFSRNLDTLSNYSAAGNVRLICQISNKPITLNILFHVFTYSAVNELPLTTETQQKGFSLPTALESNRLQMKFKKQDRMSDSRLGIVWLGFGFRFLSLDRKLLDSD